MPKIIYQYLDDGTHMHLKHGVWSNCSKNHKKVDWNGIITGAGFFLFFTLAIHLILKANGL